MFAIGAHHTRETIRIDRMIQKSSLVAFALGVHYQLVVEIEQIGALEAIVYLSTAIGLILANNFTAVLGDELVLERSFFQKTAPSGDLRLAQQQMLVHSAMYGNVGAAAERHRLVCRFLVKATRTACH